MILPKEPSNHQSTILFSDTKWCGFPCGASLTMGFLINLGFSFKLEFTKIKGYEWNRCSIGSTNNNIQTGSCLNYKSIDSTNYKTITRLKNSKNSITMFTTNSIDTKNLIRTQLNKRKFKLSIIQRTLKGIHTLKVFLFSK